MIGIHQICQIRRIHAFGKSRPVPAIGSQKRSRHTGRAGKDNQLPRLFIIERHIYGLSGILPHSIECRCQIAIVISQIDKRRDGAAAGFYGAAVKFRQPFGIGAFPVIKNCRPGHMEIFHSIFSHSPGLIGVDEGSPEHILVYLP